MDSGGVWMGRVRMCAQLYPIEALSFVLHCPQKWEIQVDICRLGSFR